MVAGAAGQADGAIAVADVHLFGGAAVGLFLDKVRDAGARSDIHAAQGVFLVFDELKRDVVEGDRIEVRFQVFADALLVDIEFVTIGDESELIFDADGFAGIVDADPEGSAIGIEESGDGAVESGADFGIAHHEAAIEFKSGFEFGVGGFGEEATPGVHPVGGFLEGEPVADGVAEIGQGDRINVVLVPGHGGEDEAQTGAEDVELVVIEAEEVVAEKIGGDDAGLGVTIADEIFGAGNQPHGFVEHGDEIGTGAAGAVNDVESAQVDEPMGMGLGVRDIGTDEEAELSAAACDELAGGGRIGLGVFAGAENALEDFGGDGDGDDGLFGESECEGVGVEESLGSQDFSHEGIGDKHEPLGGDVFSFVQFGAEYASANVGDFTLALGEDAADGDAGLAERTEKGESHPLGEAVGARFFVPVGVHRIDVVAVAEVAEPPFGLEEAHDEGAAEEPLNEGVADGRGLELLLFDTAEEPDDADIGGEFAEKPLVFEHEIVGESGRIEGAFDGASEGLGGLVFGGVEAAESVCDGGGSVFDGQDEHMNASTEGIEHLEAAVGPHA